jgi:hypothetical protein
MDKETNLKDGIPLELSVHMEEYKERSREILQRVEFQQRFLNYTLLSIGLVVGLISSSSDKWNEVPPWVAPGGPPIIRVHVCVFLTCPTDGGRGNR